MHRKLIAGVAALSLALGSVSAPARADQTDVGKIIAGIAILAMIANANNNRTGGNVQVTTSYNYPILPQDCLASVDTRNGPHYLYTQYCMNRSYPTNYLPQRCLETVRSPWGPQTGYAAQCLYDAGFRPADRYGRGHEDRHDNGRRGHD